MKLKISLIILLILGLFSNFVFAQNVSNSSVSEETAVENIINPETNFQISDSNSSGTNASVENENSRPSSAWAFIRMILVLILVIVIIYLVMNFFKKSINGGKTGNDDAYLRKVAHLNLGPGKSVQVVTLLENCYVLGVSDSGVNLIGEVNDKELISAMNISADKAIKTSKAKNFAEVLEMFMPSKSTKTTSATKTNIYSESTQNVQDFVKKQRTRINKKDDSTKR